MIPAAELYELREQLHAAQLELAPISRDDIYQASALRWLIYQELPELYLRLLRIALDTKEDT